MTDRELPAWWPDTRGLSAAGRPPLGYDLRYAAECCDVETTLTVRGAAGPDPEGAPMPARCLICGRGLRLERTSPAGWQAPDDDEEDLLDELEHDETVALDAADELIPLDEVLAELREARR